MKRIVRWVLVACVILFLPVVAVCSFLVRVWISVTSYGHPPPMFAQQFADANLWRNRTDMNAAITEMLNKNFPPGTLVSDLKSSLSKEGFRDVPPPPPNCVPKEAEVPVGVTYQPCYNHRNQMEYEWAMGFVCGGRIHVEWTVDEAGKVIHIEGFDGSACL